MAYAPYQGPTTAGNYQRFGVKTAQNNAPQEGFIPFRSVGAPIGANTQPGGPAAPTSFQAPRESVAGIPQAQSTLPPAINTTMPVAQNGLANPVFNLGGGPVQTQPQPTGTQAPIAPNAPQLGAAPQPSSMSQEDPWAWLNWAQQRDPETYKWQEGAPVADNYGNYQSMLEQAGLWQPGYVSESQANAANANREGGTFDPVYATGGNPYDGLSMRFARGPGHQKMQQLLDRDGKVVGQQSVESFDSLHEDSYRSMASVLAMAAGGYYAPQLAAAYGGGALGATAAGGTIGALGGQIATGNTAGTVRGGVLGAAAGYASNAMGNAPGGGGSLTEGMDANAFDAGYNTGDINYGGQPPPSNGMQPLPGIDGMGVTVPPTTNVPQLDPSGQLPPELAAAAGGGALNPGPVSRGQAGSAGTGWNWENVGGRVSDAASRVGDAILDNPFRSAATGLALYNASGGGGGSGSGPTFDGPGAIQQQTQANQDTALFNAYLNRPDQVTPYGNSTWTLRPGADPKNPKPGDWIQTTSLSPNQQQLLNSDEQLAIGLNGSAQSALGRVNSTLNSPLDISGAPARGEVSNFTGADRQRIEDALMQRMAPGFAQDEEAMRSRVLNTGFELGSEGAMREQTRLDRAKNDARLAAIAQSGQEAERLGNISRADATFQNQSRQQAIQEILAQRALPLNELNSIRNGTQVTMPQFSPINQSNASSTDVISALMAQFKGEQNNQANSQAGYNALLSQLANLWGQD